jgi:hypothetical protein
MMGMMIIMIAHHPGGVSAPAHIKMTSYIRS